MFNNIKGIKERRDIFYHVFMMIHPSGSNRRDYSPLKHLQNSMSDYERSHNCAYDPRPSFLAIGGLGWQFFCLFTALIIIGDCEAIFRNKELLCGRTETYDCM